ncbi:MAG: hypothetical protein R3F43_22460 [bacterium]
MQDDDFQLAVTLPTRRVALEAGGNAGPRPPSATPQHLEPVGDARARASARLLGPGRQPPPSAPPPRDLHLHAAWQIDLRHPLLFAEWATILRELAPLIEGAEPALAQDLLRRAAEVEAALGADG